MKYVDEKDITKLKKVNVSSWDSLKDNVYIRLMNKKNLSSYGDNIVHKNFLDLVMVFSVQEKSDNTIISHMLTTEELEKFNITYDEVEDIAINNTTYDRKKRVLSFKENLLKSYMMYPVLEIEKGAMIGSGGKSSSDCGVINDVYEKTNQKNILMIGNKYDIFGASYIVIPEILEEVYAKFKENFYVIPLSIHQVMCVREGYALKEGEKSYLEANDDLLDMIEDFNDSQNKSWKDILSYKIYHYLGDDGKRLHLINK